MKVLIVNPYPILPPLHGGRTRTAGLAEGLARAGAEVTVLCPWNPGQPLRGRCAGYEIRSTFSAVHVLPRILPGRHVSPLALLSLEPLRGARRRLARFADADVVQFDFCAQARWMPLVPPRARIVYSAHNVERDFWGPAGPGTGRARSVRWLGRVERLERQAIRGSDLVVTVSDRDARRLAGLYGAPRRSLVVPQGFDARLLELDRARQRPAARRALGLEPGDRAILFVGGPGRHNREAAAFLTRDVLPRLGPGAVLILVGRSADGIVADSRLRPVGFARDLDAYLAAADIGVNATESGCGASLKVMQYLGAGLPVISTPGGIAGFEAPPAGVRLVPRSGFVEALEAPLEGLAPDAAALARYAWPRLGAGLFAAYEELLGRRR